MQILLATTEVTPFAKAGGLADVASALPIEWQKYGQDPIVVMPKYSFMDDQAFGFKPTDLTISVKMGFWTEYGRLWYGLLPYSKVPVYLIENADYFDRSGIYGDPHEFPDNDRRFIFFSRAVFETARALQVRPDIIHAHDFHTAMTMAFLKSQYRLDYHFTRTAGVYTIHNLGYQGWWDPGRAMDLSTFGKDQFYPGCWFEKNGLFNAMKAGIMFADKITTVSPTYAKEIRMPWYSEGMQNELNQRGADLIGVLNGVYYDEWNPQADDQIFQNYDIDSLGNKKINKAEYLKSFGIEEHDNNFTPLVGMVTRLTEQKGIDLVRSKIEKYLAENKIRFTMLGTGEQHHEEYFRNLQKKYPENVLLTIGYDNKLAHKLIAASDFFLMPSKYEPCGLTQMYSLKYGTIPVVRQTGGLADTVTEYKPHSGEGNGFVFLHYWDDDFDYALSRAIRLYAKMPHWDIIRKNAMSMDFPSSKTALEYLKVFRWALQKVRGNNGKK